MDKSGRSKDYSFENSRKIASLFFGWALDNMRTRLIFYKVPDVAGRNIQRFGKSLIIYPRWIENGYENELMRLTDFMNSLPIDRREELVGLTRLKPMRPSEELVSDLWDLAKGRMPFEYFSFKYGG
jgi:hypothetical protein